ncbi:hypothetical protein RYX36_010666 [Vicia faba]
MSDTNNRTMRSSSHWKSFYSFADKVKRFPGLMRRTIWKVGKDDPRRIFHSLKVGLTLSLVSLLYLMEPLFKGIGTNAIWAVMTVVVVMEFTVGGTLCNGSIFYSVSCMYSWSDFSSNFYRCCSFSFRSSSYVCEVHSLYKKEL